VSPVKYKLGFYIPEDDILQLTESTMKSVGTRLLLCVAAGNCVTRNTNAALIERYTYALIYGIRPYFRSAECRHETNPAPVRRMKGTLDISE
jgi:hypothetical protein